MKTNEQRKRGQFWMDERKFPCAECGAKSGEPCVALRNSAYVKRGVSVVSHHVSRALAAKKQFDR